MRCQFCNRGTNDSRPPTSHDPGCPFTNGKLDRSKEIAFDTGWKHGRSGQKPLNQEDPSYMLGFLRGEAALEAAENGCDRAIC